MSPQAVTVKQATGLVWLAARVGVWQARDARSLSCDRERTGRGKRLDKNKLEGFKVFQD